MEHVPLASTGRSTTRLGFGCTALMGSLTRRQSLALLEAAWDAGIRHFDVAPAYGWGEAESCLGEFLNRHSGEITVTTKFGILPPQRPWWLGLGRRLASPVIRRAPGAKQRLARAANAALGKSQKSQISVPEARASLERSRAALRADRIDLWLLHDIAAARLEESALLDFLRESVASGKIGDFGVSHDIAQIAVLWEQQHDYCHVLQFEWSVLRPVPPFAGSFRIHHRALAHNLAALRAHLEEHPEVCRDWSREVDYDLAAPASLAALMLRGVLAMNPGCIALVSSKNPGHIAANVRAANDPLLEERARRLYALVQREGIAPVQGTRAGATPASS